MSSNRKKILLAVDGSNQSLEAVRYVSENFSPQEIKVVLLHVLSKKPEVFYDLEKVPDNFQADWDFRGWERSLDASIREFMGEARQILVDARVPEGAISLDIQERKIGIARDIFAKSIHGYSAVVLGRHGASKFKDFVIGSIASKLLERLAHVAVCIVGGRPPRGKILLALDESENAMRAVDFVGAMFSATASQVTLFHAVRGFNIWERRYEDILDPKYEDEWIHSYEIDSLFEEAKMHLVKLGFAPKCVATKLVPRVSSRAAAIVEEAKQGGYGTIVVGRRGLSKVREFFMGRVSNKVVQLARREAVWIVS